METNKIELRRDREFGEIFNATFEFIKQEVKPFGKVLLITTLPFVVLSGIVMAYYQSTIFGMGHMSANDPFGFLRKIGGLVGLLMMAVTLSQTMLQTTTLAYLKLYMQGKEDITVSDVWEEIKKIFFPVLGAMLLVGLCICVGFVFCIIPGI